MQLVTAPPGVWLYTETASYNQMRMQGYGNFLSQDQQAKLERLRQATMLYAGRHREYFLDESRTQFDNPPMQVGSRMIQPYLRHNLLRLISFKSSDLLLGSEAQIKVDSSAQQDSIKALVERSSLQQLFYSGSRDGTYQAETFLEAVIYSGEVNLKQVPAEEIFAIGRMTPSMQYDRYDRYSLQNVGTDQKQILLLLVTSYLKGQILRNLYQLSDDGKQRRQIDLGQWQLQDGEPPLLPIQNTGIDQNTITWIPNELDAGSPVSDYDILIDHQDALNSKETQLARVLAKHADPKMAFPQQLANKLGQAPNADAFFFRGEADIPKYLTWNAEVGAAVTERNEAKHSLLILAETSPVLLGMRDGAGNAAYKKVKVEAMNSLKKAERKSVYWNIGIRRAITTAQSLELTIHGKRYDRGPIGVTLQDGIPLDDLDEATRLATLRGAGILSLRRAIQDQLDDPAAVEAELAELKLEFAAATPSVFFPGTAMPGNPAQAQIEAGGEETAAAAADSQQLEEAA